ncbi:MAG: hypothetical protein QW051_04800 [Candidatus Aenigmatarchaeota archaeon]
MRSFFLDSIYTVELAEENSWKDHWNYKWHGRGKFQGRGKIRFRKETEGLYLLEDENGFVWFVDESELDSILDKSGGKME